MKRLYQKAKHAVYYKINLYKSMFYKRDSKTILFGAWFGEKFADNPKYLYLQALKHDDWNPIWITKNVSVYNELLALHLPVVIEDSPEGKELQKSAKFYVVCTGKRDIGTNYVGGAIVINLWHGIPLKKIMWADSYHSVSYPRYFLKKITEYLPLRKEYIISTSEKMQEIYRQSFRKNKKHVLVFGQPRNDMFFSDSFPESKNIEKIKSRKIITYMPTHRDEGKSLLDIKNLINLEALEDVCSKYDYYFLIKKHFYHKDERFDDHQYKHIYDITNKNVDTQELLKYTDILITDYSSCFIDYLLLNRPIIFFAFDYEHYLATDREMYFNYETVAPGPIVKTGKDLLTILEETILNPDMQYEKRQEIRRIFYDDTSCEACGEKILQFMKGLS